MAHTMFLLGTTYTPFTKCLARKRGAKGLGMGSRECFSTNVWVPLGQLGDF